MGQTQGAGLIQLLPLIFLFVVFYFLLIRPQRKKQIEHQKMIESLKKNDEVVTVGGIHGTIINVKEKTFVIRVDDNVKIEIDKSSIAYVKKQRKE
ncbi:MAG: preprotein translocase subunit YajC [Candidatus Omnitrophota bacterium]|nr:MAG: preprotein translocase subunit YajC [Candidatus Omnitrophota bacterium]HDN86647.1 preprotein translocase subunit YajC [Candidatus Omnitrophota bacterium]